MPSFLRGLPSIGKMAGMLGEEYGIGLRTTLGKRNPYLSSLAPTVKAWQQTKPNCLQIANAVAEKFGYQLPSGRSQSDLTRIAEWYKPGGSRYGKDVSPVNAILFQNKAGQGHIAIEAYGRQYNYGAKSDLSLPMVAKIPLPKMHSGSVGDSGLDALFNKTSQSGVLSNINKFGKKGIVSAFMAGSLLFGGAGKAMAWEQSTHIAVAKAVGAKYPAEAAMADVRRNLVHWTDNPAVPEELQRSVARIGRVSGYDAMHILTDYSQPLHAAANDAFNQTYHEAFDRAAHGVTQEELSGVSATTGDLNANIGSLILDSNKAANEYKRTNTVMSHGEAVGRLRKSVAVIKQYRNTYGESRDFLNTGFSELRTKQKDPFRAGNPAIGIPKHEDRWQDMFERIGEFPRRIYGKVIGHHPGPANKATEAAINSDFTAGRSYTGGLYALAAAKNIGNAYDGKDDSGSGIQPKDWARYLGPLDDIFFMALVGGGKGLTFPGHLLKAQQNEVSADVISKVMSKHHIRMKPTAGLYKLLHRSAHDIRAVGAKMGTATYKAMNNKLFNSMKKLLKR